MVYSCIRQALDGIRWMRSPQCGAAAIPLVAIIPFHSAYQDGGRCIRKRGQEHMTTTAERLEQAISLKVEGSYDEAVEILTALLQEDSGNAEVHHQLGLIYGFQGLFDESLQELETASGLQPERVEILIDLAMTYAMLGMYDEAKQGFERVLELDPENRKAREQMVYFEDMAAAG